MNTWFSKEDFRTALECCVDDMDLRRLERFQAKRALRNPRVFDRLFDRLAPRMASDLAFGGPEDLLQWIVDNWGQIFKMIQDLISLFSIL